MRLPVRFRVTGDLPRVRSVCTHDKYISLIVISQRVKGDPLTIGGVRAGSIVASIGELGRSFCGYIDAKDILIARRACIDQEILSIR